MSVLAKFFEMALLLTFMLLCINGILFYFGDALISNPTIPISTLTGDQNTFVSVEENSSNIEQSATQSTPPVDEGGIGTAITQLGWGFEIKLTAMLANYPGLESVGTFVWVIFNIIKLLALIYLALAIAGTILGGSVP